MRRAKIMLQIGLLICVIASPVAAWRIPSYNIRMDIQPDSSVIITEIITADFTGDPHHGIYREIPLSGQDRFGNNYRFRHEILSVTDERGSDLQAKITNKSGRMHIRIGSPYVYVSDQRAYIIRYRLMRAVHFFQEHDELYWNAVGHEWEVSIEQATCTVTLPSDVGKDRIRTASYTGIYGSTITEAMSDAPDGRSVRFWMTRPLHSGEGMTIVVGWPKGIVRQPEFKEEASWFVRDNSYFFLPPVFFLLLLGLWHRAGRDPDTGRSEMVAYDPPDDLRPAELGTLIDEKVDMRDISASIIDLAVRGYLTIKPHVDKGLFFSKTDYMLELTRPVEQIKNEAGLNGFERELIGGIFGASDWRWISSLKNSFYIHLPRIRDEIYDSLVRRGYFTHSPASVRLAYQILGLGLVAVAVIAGIFARPFTNVPLGWHVAVALCGLMLAASAYVMPRKTVKGKNALLGARGFEEYLSRAERQEIEHQERQNYFEKFLPYAMAFGIADKWARAFDGIQIAPPNWYTADGRGFHPSLFAHDLSSAGNDWAGAMSSQPRSSGSSGFFGGGSGFSGGSSGGGGGGGGGGGW